MNPKIHLAIFSATIVGVSILLKAIFFDQITEPRLLGSPRFTDDDLKVRLFLARGFSRAGVSSD